jgi:hypothetical protein
VTPVVNVWGGEKQLLAAVVSGTGWLSLAQAIRRYALGATAGMTALTVARSWFLSPSSAAAPL